MKKYNFLFKPLFFICSLVFATWMTLTIERLQPSDFSRYTSLFDHEIKKSEPVRPDFARVKNTVKQLCLDFKNGKIDSLSLENKIQEVLAANR